MVHSNTNTMPTELHSLFFFCFYRGRGTTLYYILYTFSVLGGDGGNDTVAGWSVGKTCLSFCQKRFSIGISRGW